MTAAASTHSTLPQSSSSPSYRLRRNIAESCPNAYKCLQAVWRDMGHSMDVLNMGGNMSLSYYSTVPCHRRWLAFHRVIQSVIPSSYLSLEAQVLSILPVLFCHSSHILVAPVMRWVAVGVCPRVLVRFTPLSSLISTAVLRR